jgi:hypothetical protein
MPFSILTPSKIRKLLIPDFTPIEQIEISEHREANLDIVILFRSLIHSAENSALENIAETMRGDGSRAPRSESRLMPEKIIGSRLKLPLAPSQIDSRYPPHAKT